MAAASTRGWLTGSRSRFRSVNARMADRFAIPFPQVRALRVVGAPGVVAGRVVSSLGVVTVSDGPPC